MNPKSIIVLGASRYYLRSIEAAQRAGYHVIALDRDPQAASAFAANHFEVCDIVDGEKALKLAKKHGVAGILPLNDYGVKTAAFVAQEMGLPGISLPSAELATNKELMRKEWSKKGLPCPAFSFATTLSEFKQALAIVGYPCIFKPAHGIGGGSRGVIVVENESHLEDAIQFTQSFYQDKLTIVEGFVSALSEHSAEAIVYDNQVHILAIADKVKSPLPYRVDKNVLYPSALKGEQLKQAQQVIEQAIFALGLDIGAVHIEFAMTAQGPVLFELGARCGGGGTPEPIVSHVTGIKALDETIRILAGDKPLNLEAVQQNACNYHFLTPPPGVVKAVEGLDKVLALPYILDADLFVGVNQTISPLTIGPERAGFLIVAGQTQEEVLSLGQQAEAMIHFDYQ